VSKQKHRKVIISDDPYEALKQGLEYHPEMLQFMGVGNEHAQEDTKPDEVSKYLDDQIRRRKHASD
jgi:hypothetical protein